MCDALPILSTVTNKFIAYRTARLLNTASSEDTADWRCSDDHPLNQHRAAQPMRRDAAITGQKPQPVCGFRHNNYSGNVGCKKGISELKSWYISYLLVARSVVFISHLFRSSLHLPTTRQHSIMSFTALTFSGLRLNLTQNYSTSSQFIADYSWGTGPAFFATYKLV